MAKRYLLVGTWSDFGGHGEGIHVFRINEADGTLVQTDHLQGYTNTSILSMSADQQTVYSTIETKDYQQQWGNGGGVLALQFDAKHGKLSVRNEMSSFGACTSYVCADPEGQFLLATNHGSGLDVVTKVVQSSDGSYHVVKEYDDAPLVMYTLQPNGAIDRLADLKKHTGRGALSVRGQVCSHLHSVHFDPSGNWVIVCDKGCDRIYAYKVNRMLNCLEENRYTVFHARGGTAPRHLEFHPTRPWCYLNNETASSVTALRFDADSGLLTEIDEKPMVDMAPDVDPNLIGDTYGSPADIHVHPNGAFVLSSQRSSYHTGKGTDLIAVFRIDENNGALQRVHQEKMDGPCPRGFAISPDGKYVYVGNQYQDTIVRYRFDEKTGKLRDRELVANVKTPTCILIADVEEKD